MKFNGLVRQDSWTEKIKNKNKEITTCINIFN